jgi:hypothetical protein
MGALLFCPLPRLVPQAAPCFGFAPGCRGSPSAREDISMARINKLLRSAPSRIGQRIAQFVAIAAASLPDAGA